MENRRTIILPILSSCPNFLHLDSAEGLWDDESMKSNAVPASPEVLSGTPVFSGCGKTTRLRGLFDLNFFHALLRHHHH